MMHVLPKVDAWHMMLEGTTFELNSTNLINQF